MNLALPTLEFAASRYNPAECAVFCKTRERFGGCSNMAAGYPLRVNGTPILTSEALYQSFRFPHRPEIQSAILASKSPMGAKMVARANTHWTRSDWNAVRVGAMWWSLLLKMHLHTRAFGSLLYSTGTGPIVELSRRDPFWGAMTTVDGSLVGQNILGKLLMAIRGADGGIGMWLNDLEPPADLVPNALFLGVPIRPIQKP